MASHGTSHGWTLGIFVGSLKSKDATEFYLLTMQYFHVFSKFLIEYVSRARQSLAFCRL